MRNVMAALAALLVALPADATVTGNQPPSVYTCNGTTTSFVANFPYLAASQVTATVTTGSSVVTLTQPADYSVKPSIAPSTGTATLTDGSKCPSGSTLTISRAVPFTQPQSFRTGAYAGAAHEQAFDRLEMQIQQNAATAATLTAKDAAQDLAISAAINPTPVAVNSNALVLATGSTTSRTLADRSSDVINVKDYGAKGDCTTDDTTAFAAGLTAAAGRTLYVPLPSGGCYKITATLTIPAYTVVKGASEGAGGSHIKKFFSGDMINQGSASGIRDIYLDGNFASFTGRTVIITSGFGQWIDHAQISCIGNAAGYCVEYTAANAGTQGYIINSTFAIQTAYNVAIKYPDAADVGAAPRSVSNCQGGGAILLDFASCNDCYFVGNFTNGLAFNTSLSAHAFIIGNRIATGGAATTIRGGSHQIVGNSFAGNITLDASTTAVNLIGELPAVTDSGTSNLILGSGRGLLLTNALTLVGAGANAIGGATSADARLRLLGSFTGSVNVQGVSVTDTLTAPVGGLGAGVAVTVVLNKAASGTHATFSSLDLSAPGIGGGAATITDAATLLIRSAPSAGTNNDALRIAGGTLSMGGTTFAGLGTPRNGTFIYCTDCLAGSSPCTGASTGSFAFRQSGAWKCQ